MATYFNKIETITVGSGGSSIITFSSIPQTYTDLMLKVSARTTDTQSIGPITLRFNSATSNYTSRDSYGTGTSMGSTSRGNIGSALYLGNGVGNAATANTFGNMEVYISQYTGGKYKTLTAENVGEDNSSTAYSTYISGLWSDTSAITSISIIGLSTDLMQYSSFTLYGIKSS